MSEQKLPRVRKTLISSCFSISINQIPPYKELVKGKEHSCVITRRNDAAFLYITPAGAAEVKARVVVGDATYRRTIRFAYRLVGYGARRWIGCDCGRLVNSLYLKDSYIACRHCHNLLYDIRRFTKGSIRYRINRQQAINALKNKITYITFGDYGYTRKAKRLMEMTKMYR